MNNTDRQDPLKVQPWLFCILGRPNQPSESFQHKIVSFECLFQMVHKEGLSSETNIMEKLHNHINDDFPGHGLPHEVCGLHK